MTAGDWKSAANAAAIAVEERLAVLLSDQDSALSMLFEGMRYSALAGGKRIRPFLVLAFSALLGGKKEAALSFAAAVEMVHTYSLIHDDLPCMDNDDYRRGRLTNHKVYGEAAAVLAGDALLTMAFETIAHAETDASCRVRAVQCLAAAAGARGMVGGQMMDIRAEKEKPSLEVLCHLQELKTGALICAAVELGCLAAGVTNEEVLNACRTYASGIGCAFQIVDDVLDVYGDQELLGKSIGQDARDGKVTFLTYMTKEEALTEAAALTATAKKALSGFEGAEMLCSFADALLSREK